MHVARLGGILSVSNRLATALPRLPPTPTRLQLQSVQPSYIFPSACLFPSISPSRVVRRLEVARPSSRDFSGSTRMAANGHVRQKRKGNPVNTHERPAKLFRPQRSDTLNSDHSVDSQYLYGGDSIADAIIEPIMGTGENAEWQATIEQVVKNVVSIHFCQTCSFDTSPALSSEATGFVVDATKGYILTNRHVVGSGPFWGYCIFDNHEEVIIAIMIILRLC